MNVLKCFKIYLVIFIYSTTLFNCNTLHKISDGNKINDILGANNLMDIFKKPDPITTNFSDTKQDNSLLNSFGNNKKFKRLSEQPRSENGSYILQPGFYEITSKSYCLHAGSHGPSDGDGYLFASLKGTKKDIIQAIIRNSSNKSNIPQATVQMLIWAVLAKTNFQNLSTELKIASTQLLTAKQLYELNGGALGLLPTSAIDKFTESLPKPAKEAILLENKMRGLFEQGNSTYQDFERIAVIAGKAPNIKEYVSGSWSKHPNGYYVRYFPFSYRQTKVQIYVPQNKGTGYNNSNNIVSYASYKLEETVKYDGTNDVAVPANTGAQRLQQTNDDVNDNQKDSGVPHQEPKLDLCHYPAEGLSQIPKDLQIEKTKTAQQLQDLTRGFGIKPDITPFDDIDGAGMAAIRYINGTSIKENLEYSGQIYLNPLDGKFYFSSPVFLNGESGSSTSNPKDSNVPKGMTIVGDYHTHGGEFKYSDEIFSPPPFPGDVMTAMKQNNENAHYLGTPQGRIEKLVIPKNWKSGDGRGLCDFITQLN